MRILLGMVMLCVAAAAQSQSAVIGGITPKVVCSTDATQDYALFLPSNYDRAHKWPIIYAFDAAARGALPLELAKDAAEKFGYIIAGSNQSANFNPQAQRAAVECLWADTHGRLNIDDARIYVTGFSGGSRLASGLAGKCSPEFCVAGVIAHGAGFLEAKLPKGEIKFVYFATVGDLDFNHPEMIELRNQLEEAGVPNRLIVFPGPHQWGPASTWMDALAWLQVQAMRKGALPKDAAFIASQLQAARQRAQQAAGSDDPYAAWREYAGIVRDFAGLVDVTAEQQTAAALKRSSGSKQGARRERDAIQDQRALTAEMGGLYTQLSAEDSDRMLVAQQFMGKMAALRERIAKQKDAAAKLVAQRALAQVTAILFEGAQADRLDRRWDAAALKTEIACASVERPTRGLVQAAKDYARSGNEGKALNLLKRAIENGFSDTQQLETAEEFANLREKVDFQRLVATTK